MKTKEERKQRKAERKRKPHFVRHSFGMAFGVIFLGAAIVIPQITMPFNGMLQRSFYTGYTVKRGAQSTCKNCRRDQAYRSTCICWASTCN